MQKIIVFGSTGMLGNYVSRYLKSKDFNVVDINRRDLDASNLENIYVYLENQMIIKQVKEGDVFINCIGVIKQRSNDKYKSLAVNSLFPYTLLDFAERRKTHYIHVTTDCAYNGIKGDYDENDIVCPCDYYGITKSQGEPSQATVIRTSIIGEELLNKKSLIEWVKSQKDQEVKGYTNHIWNGITCLQFAKICEEMINKNFFWKNIKHIHSPDKVNKFELVKLISDIYDLNLNIVPFETPEKCDRSLRSIRTDINFDIPSLKDQIIEQKIFGENIFC